MTTDIKEKPNFQVDVVERPKKRRAPLYNVFLDVIGPLTPGPDGMGFEIPDECEQALMEVFEQSEGEATQTICETLTVGSSLVGSFSWEVADHKTVSANKILARNTTYTTPHDKPVQFNWFKT